MHIHCNFAHTPVGIAMYAALLRGTPFSFLCHAHDIFVHAAAMREKVDRAAFGMCSSRYNVRFLADTKGCDEAKLDVMRTGLDLHRFVLRAPKPFSKPFRFLSVGRLVEKKGFPVFFDALALLAQRGRDFEADVVGGGPMDAALHGQIGRLGLAGRVRLAGPQPQERVRRYFDEADAFVLACLEAGNRDMDGTPIVLIEAMALGVPVISTPVSGNPELIESGNSGLLVLPGDVAALADAMESLMDTPELARRLAENARRTIESGFDLESNIAHLVRAIEKGIADS
jgi:glycosyltransferase involved in cell wall biosynthesis